MFDKPVKRVAVIGAGASGIVAIKELLRYFEVVCFEARPRVGGAWIRSPEAPEECLIFYDAEGRPFTKTREQVEGSNWPALLDPSPMYELRTNIPADGMSYRGFPFEGTSGPFPRDDEVLQYIEDYAKDVKQHVRFSTIVKRIYKSEGRWQVQFQSTDGAAAQADTFDAICDASGHYTVPYIPRIEGLWGFRGKLLHSKWYRSPSSYTQQNVLVCGNRASGSDVARQIATEMKDTGSSYTVYQSVRSGFEMGIDPRDGPPWSSHLKVVPPVLRMTEDSITVQNGNVLRDIGIVIFATGYLYSFAHFQEQDAPFNSHSLTSTPPISEKSTSWSTSAVDADRIAEYPVGGLQVRNIDADYQTFYTPDPTLAFVCLNKSIIPFPLAQVQAHAIAKVWSGYPIKLREQTESEAEDPALHTYGAPREFDVEDALLEAVGEGRKISSGHVNGTNAYTNGHVNGSHDEDTRKEILPDGKFPAVSVWRREERPRMVAYRQKILGY